MSKRTHRLTVPFAAWFILACTNTLMAVGAAPPQTPQRSTPVSAVIVGETVWGKAFQQELGRGLALRVELLGGSRSVQNGIYVSVINKNNPKGYEFVLLPDLINTMESNFIGTMAYAGADPKEVSDRLMEALESASKGWTELTYFTGRFNRSQLQRIRDANVTLGHHGLPEHVYAEAQRVLDELDKITGSFKVLAYRLGEDTTTPGALRIEYVKFSFDTSRTP